MYTTSLPLTTKRIVVEDQTDTATPMGPLDQENQSERRQSGDIRPIPWASLMLIAFCGEFSGELCIQLAMNFQ